MTELYYVGTEAECNVVRDAMNVVMDYPTPPLGSGLSSSEQTPIWLLCCLAGQSSTQCSTPSGSQGRDALASCRLTWMHS
jgi:hypothetical protein